MSVAFRPGHLQRTDFRAVDHQTDHGLAPTREPTNAPTIPPQKRSGRKIVKCQIANTHHHPTEQPHQRDLFPCLAISAISRDVRCARACASRRGFGTSLSTRSSGVRSAVGSRSGGCSTAVAGSAPAVAGASAVGGPGARAPAAPARAVPARRLAARAGRSGRLVDIEVAHQFLELIAPELFAGLLGRDQRAAARALCAFALGLHVDRGASDRPSRTPGTSPSSRTIRARRCAIGALALLPVCQDRRGDEDRGVGARRDPDHQGESEVLERRAAEDAAAKRRARACKSSSPRDRVSTSDIDLFTICENAALGIRGTFSRTLSNTMIVSYSE